jgi:hypothetical protein
MVIAPGGMVGEVNGLAERQYSHCRAEFLQYDECIRAICLNLHGLTHLRLYSRDT